ncbi:MAG: methyltransferase domain-containing protein [Rhodospirillales bacterium]
MTGNARTEAHLERWNDVFESRDWGRYPPEELIRVVARNFGDAPERGDVRFLEVGCGPGANLWFLRREGFAVAGIDGSQAAIEQARARLAAEGLDDPPDRIDLRQGNFASLPWADESFDAVVDIEAIYANEMSTIRSCVAEVHRVLKPGGVFFGKMFGIKTTGHGTGDPIEDNTTGDPAEGPCAGFGLCHFFTEAELAEVFGRFASLSVDWVHRSDHEQTISIFEWLVSARK